MGKTTYERRKSEGVCVKCGGNIEDFRKGKVLCLVCTKKSSIESRKTQEYRRNLGLCPRCGKVKLIGDERNCIDCRLKNNIQREQQRLKNPEIETIYTLHANANRRIKYHERKAKGLCVSCGKSLSAYDEGYSNCFKCRNKTAKYRVKSTKDKRMYKQNIWKANGLCPLCGEPLYESHGLCKKHYDMQIEKHDFKRNKKLFIGGNNGIQELCTSKSHSE